MNVYRHVLVAAFLASVLIPSGVGAQATRASLVDRAVAAAEAFETAEAVALTRLALDPSLGAPDSAWVRGVHLLAQLLYESGRADEARIWARWAMRLEPSLPADSVNFLKDVAVLLLAARDSVAARQGDESARTTWQWPSGAPEALGYIGLAPLGADGPLTVTILDASGRAVGQLPPPGASLSLAPGTYEIGATASGSIPARIRREVLPGVTTLLSFDLASASYITGTLSSDASAAALRATVTLQSRRFGVPAPSCGAAAVVGSRLVLTSYRAIRGAEGATVLGAASPLSGDPRVAAYDVASDLAVLELPSPVRDSILLAPRLVDQQALWGVSTAECRAQATERTSLERWDRRPVGPLLLLDSLSGSASGAPMIDYLGRAAAVWVGGRQAIAMPQVEPLLARARANASAGASEALADVARRENHLFGSLIVTADVSGATVRISPLEPWHWPELAGSGPAPYSFTGPAGRYRVETSAAGVPARTSEVLVRAGALERRGVSLVVAAAPPPQPVAAPAKSGRRRLLWAVAGIGGGAIAYALVSQGEGSKFGSIGVRVPANIP